MNELKTMTPSQINGFLKALDDDNWEKKGREFNCKLKVPGHTNVSLHIGRRNREGKPIFLALSIPDEWSTIDLRELSDIRTALDGLTKIQNSLSFDLLEELGLLDLLTHKTRCAPCATYPCASGQHYPNDCSFVDEDLRWSGPAYSPGKWNWHCNDCIKSNHWMAEETLQEFQNRTRCREPDAIASTPPPDNMANHAVAVTDKGAYTLGPSVGEEGGGP